ncbi:toll/interleukin-1 receptor domain-containing protein [Caldithrix abyssi]|nr:toll/interleukin-1 receptor domain-containing protein [Caldithrix abyssi]
MKFNIFISYSTGDLKNVDMLRKQISDTQINVFIAEYSVEVSEELPSKIKSEIKKCDLFVLLWSENAKNSDWVSLEIGQAIALNKRILPLVLTRGLRLPAFINNLKYEPIYTNPKESMFKVREIILKQYEVKKGKFAKQKKKDNLVLLGLGAFIFWALLQE